MTDIQNGQYYNLGSKVFWIFVLQRSATAIALLVVAVLLSVIRAIAVPRFELVAGVDINYIFSATIAGAFILAIIAEIVGAVIAWLEYGVSKIMLDTSSLKIIRGILGKEELEIPYRRIQSVEIKQSLNDRLLGVGRVIIATTTDLNQPNSSTEREADDEVIPLMNYDLAQAVADTLSNRAEVERMQVQKNND